MSNVGDIVLYEIPGTVYGSSSGRFVGVVVGIETINSKWLGWRWVLFARNGAARKMIDLVDAPSLVKVASSREVGWGFFDEDIEETYEPIVGEQRGKLEGLWT